MKARLESIQSRLFYFDVNIFSMIYLHQSILTPLKAAVERNSEECCGFLFGSDLGTHRVISTMMDIDNEAFDRRRTFRISSRNYLKAENFALCNNFQLLGVYHSHPDAPAVPSEFDRVAAQPYFSYLILSVMNRKVTDMRSWNLCNNSQFEEQRLIVLNINQHVYGYRNNPYPAA
jgi:proteasome lid subunit RPN8/RPN11